MEFAEVVRRRRMVRTFDPDRPVSPGELDRMLEHAIRAPSAGFTQGWDFLVLSTEAERERFWAATTGPGSPDGWLTRMRTAPALIVCFSDAQAYLDRYAEPDKGWVDRDRGRWPVPYWDVDTGMAALLILLTAVDSGLVGCFFGVPPERHDALRDALGVPAGRSPVGVVAAGHPAAGGRRSPSLRRPRRTVGDVAHRGHFGTPW